MMKNKTEVYMHYRNCIPVVNRQMEAKKALKKMGVKDRTVRLVGFQDHHHLFS